MGLALDEQKDTDDVYDLKGYTFLVDKSLIQTVAPIVVDGSQFGFKISSKLNSEAGGGCSSCTTC